MNRYIKIRHMIDFELIPSIVLSDDFEDFITATVVSEGEVFAKLFNEVYETKMPEKNIEFSKKHFGVINGKVDDETVMTIVSLPYAYGSGVSCVYYIFTYDFETFSNVRFFTVETSSDLLGKFIQLVKENANEDTDIQNELDNLPVLFLCEIKKDQHNNYGVVFGGMHEIVKKVIDILGL